MKIPPFPNAVPRSRGFHRLPLVLTLAAGLAGIALLVRVQILLSGIGQERTIIRSVGHTIKGSGGVSSNLAQATVTLARDITGQPHHFIGVVEDILVDDLRRQTPEPMVYLPAVSGSLSMSVR